MNLLRNIIEKAVWKYDNSKFHVQTSESGLHSDLYLNTDYVVSDPQLVEEIVKNIFVKELEVQNIKPDWIVSYPPFGLSISHILARECGAKFAYINRETNSCNFEIKKGDKVIVVGDDIYSGGSLKQTIEILKTMGAEVVSPILTIGNFSGTEELSGLSIFQQCLKREIYIQKMNVQCARKVQKLFCLDLIGIN